MLSKIRFALLAASVVSSVALAQPATAASHSRHTHAISRNVRAQAIERHPVYEQAAPALNDYPHTFCCS